MRAADPNSEAALDQALLSRALSGDAAAMRQVVTRLLPTVQARVGRALLKRRAQSKNRSLKQESEDLVQEAFAALFERDARVLRRWDPDKGMTLKSFAGLVAEREAGMVLRTGKRSPFTEDPASTELIEQSQHDAKPESVASGCQVEARDLLRAVCERLRAQLTPQGFFLFDLLFVQEKSTEEVMQLTGASQDSVYAWRSRLARQAREARDQLVTNGETTGRERTVSS